MQDQSRHIYYFYQNVESEKTLNGGYDLVSHKPSRRKNKVSAIVVVLCQLILFVCFCFDISLPLHDMSVVSCELTRTIFESCHSNIVHNRELLRAAANRRPRTVMRGLRSPAVRLGLPGRRRRPPAGTTTTRRRSGPGELLVTMKIHPFIW